MQDHFSASKTLKSRTWNLRKSSLAQPLSALYYKSYSLPAFPLRSHTVTPSFFSCFALWKLKRITSIPWFHASKFLQTSLRLHQSAAWSLSLILLMYVIDWLTIFDQFNCLFISLYLAVLSITIPYALTSNLLQCRRRFQVFFSEICNGRVAQRSTATIALAVG